MRVGTLRLMTLGRTIDNPDFVGVAAQILAHLLESGAIQDPGNCNEAYNAVSMLIGLSRRVVPARTEDLQRGPAPKIDVEVLEVMRMSAGAPFHWRRPSIHGRDASYTAALDPAAQSTRAILVRWIADNNRDRLLFFERVCVSARLRDWLGDFSKRFFFDKLVFQPIGDKEPEIGNRQRGHLWRRHQRLHFRYNAKLGHRERTELKFKTDHAFRCSLDRAPHGAGSLIIRDGQRDAT